MWRSLDGDIITLNELASADAERAVCAGVIERI